MSEAFDVMMLMLAVSSPFLIIMFVVMFVKHRFKLANLQAQNLNRSDKEEIAALRDQVNVLKERVSVLEAIVTDSGYQLQEKFRKL